MKLQFEENEYYLMKDGEDLAIATTDESFIKELGAERLSLKNCEAIKNGYDLDKLANEYANPYGYYDGHFGKSGFINGFQKAIELLGDKKFSEDELKLAFFHVQNKPTFAVFKESLQQTEWDVYVEMEVINEQFSPCATCIADSAYITVTKTPKLDENSCLILKRK